MPMPLMRPRRQRWRARPGEVARLLDHDLLSADLVRELLSEPLAGVDGVQLHVTEGIALDFLAVGFLLSNDLFGVLKRWLFS